MSSGGGSSSAIQALPAADKTKPPIIGSKPGEVNQAAINTGTLFSNGNDYRPASDTRAFIKTGATTGATLDATKSVVPLVKQDENGKDILDPDGKQIIFANQREQSAWNQEIANRRGRNVGYQVNVNARAPTTQPANKTLLGG